MALCATAFGCPIGEARQLVTVFPVESDKFARIEISAFLAKKRFKAPLEVGAVPRMEPVASGHGPVIA